MEKIKGEEGQSDEEEALSVMRTACGDHAAVRKPSKRKKLKTIPVQYMNICNSTI